MFTTVKNLRIGLSGRWGRFISFVLFLLFSGTHGWRVPGLTFCLSAGLCLSGVAEVLPTTATDREEVMKTRRDQHNLIKIATSY